MEGGAEQEGADNHPEAATAGIIEAEIRKIWDDAIREQDDRQMRLEKERREAEAGTSSSANASLGGRQHTLLLIDCGPSMMMMMTMMPASSHNDDLPPAAAPLSPNGAATTSLLLSSCGFVRAVRGCERFVLEHVRGVVSGKHSRSRTSRDAIGIMLYNTRVRLPVSWNHHDTKRDAPKGKPKRDDDNDDEEDEEDDENDDPDRDFLAFKTAPSRTHDFVPLEPPGVSTIHRIRAALHGKIDLAKLYGHHVPTGDDATTTTSGTTGVEQHSHMDEAIIAATSAVKAHLRTHKNDSVQTLVFTNNPNPCRIENVPALRDMVQDLRRLGHGDVIVVPMDANPLVRYGGSNNRNGDHEESDDNFLGMDVMAPTEHDDDLEDDLCERLVKSVTKARPKWRRIPLIRPDWQGATCESSSGTGTGTAEDSPSGILLDWYDLVGSATAPSEKEVDAFTGLPISSETHFLAAGGGPILKIKSGTKTLASIPPHRMPPYAVLTKDVTVPFTEFDKRRVLEASSSSRCASLTLLGFKDARDVPFYANIGKPLFVSPSAGEENSNGACAFACLRDSMIRKDVVMIGELLSKPGTVSRLVALSPWIPLPDLEVQPPPGMIARILPYREEIRDMTEAAVSEGNAQLVSDELLESTIKLVKKLTYKETPEIGMDFTNAQMDKLYNYIERVALCEPEPPDDAEQRYDTLFTKAYREERSKKLSGVIGAINDVLPKDESPKKQKVAPSKTGRKRLREARDEIGSDWISLYHESAGDLNSRVWTVPMLKAYCKEAGLSQGGKKKDLASRVTPHIEAMIANTE